MIFVLDNSVVCGWLIAEQATQYSEAIKTLLQRQQRAIFNAGER